MNLDMYLIIGDCKVRGTDMLYHKQNNFYGFKDNLEAFEVGNTI